MSVPCLPRRSWTPVVVIFLIMSGGLIAPAAIAPAGPPAPSAGEDGSAPVVATSWDVRRDAEQLIADLDREREQGQGLFQRVVTMLTDHGDSMIRDGAVFMPLSVVIARRLQSDGLSAAFVAAYGGLAKNRLDALPRDGDHPEAWRTLARSFPGTGASQQAWRHLADIAWDRGRLGEYLHYARAGDESADPRRRPRLAAAVAMLSRKTRQQLPSTLDGLDQIWRIDLDQTRTASAGGVQLNQASIDDASNQGPREACLSLTRGPGGLICANNGLRCFVFDPLVGRLVGDSHDIGDVPLTPQQCAPASDANGFVALGLGSNQRVNVMAINRDGSERWMVAAAVEGRTPMISGPVILDGEVVFAGLLFDSDGPELRLFAYHVIDGSLAWNILVAKLPVLLHGLFLSSMGSVNPPQLAVQSGSILVLANTGMLARVQTAGTISRIWSYPTTQAQMTGFDTDVTTNRRIGGIVSDGMDAVATPSDNQGIVIVLRAQEDQPRIYTGDASHAAVLAVRDGKALLGGRPVGLLDLATLHMDWVRSGPDIAFDGPLGRLGNGFALVAGRGRMGLFNAHGGAVISIRGAGDPPPGLVIEEGLIISGYADHVSASGHSAEFVADERADARLHPDDYRPLAALSSMYQAQGKDDQAYASLLEALQRHAPALYADKAASLLRDRIALCLADPVAYDRMMGQLRALTPYRPSLAAEIRYWQARHEEAIHDVTAAQADYRAVMAAPDLQVRFNEHLTVLLQAMAEAGLTRIAHGPLPAWLGPVDRSRTPLAVAKGAWRSTALRGTPTMANRSVAIAYVDGVLSAQAISTGHELWWRMPDRPLLGVRMSSVGPGGQGVQDAPDNSISVVSGSSADAAGLANNDALLTFDGHRVRNIQDLIPLVAAAGARAPFTAGVRRSGTTMMIHGILGGELVEPIGINERTVLCWPVRPSDGVMARSPEGLWFEAIDIATGRPLMRWTLPPTTSIWVPPRPLLSKDDIVITTDGEDLIGRGAHDAAAAPDRWRMTGAGHWLARAQFVGPGLALFGAPNDVRCRLVEVDTGRVLFTIPGDNSQGALLDQGDLVLCNNDHTLTLWDLAQARQRWSSDALVSEPLAITGDEVFALSDTRQLLLFDRHSGQLRLRYKPWSSVEQTAIAQDTLYVHVRTAAGQSLAAIDLTNGRIIWERRLPLALQIGHLVASAEGVGMVVSVHHLHDEVLGLSPAGKMTVVQRLDHGMTNTHGVIGPEIRLPNQKELPDALLPISGGYLAMGSWGMSVCKARPPEPGPPVPCPVIAPRKDFAATADDAYAHAIWQPILPPDGGSLPASTPSTTSGHPAPGQILGNPAHAPVDGPAYAVARVGSSLLVLIRVDQGSQMPAGLVGDNGIEVWIDAPGSIFALGDPTVMVMPGHGLRSSTRTSPGWMVEVSEVVRQTPAGIWCVAMLLSPAIDHPPGLVSRIFVAPSPDDQHLGQGPTPWWLRSSWRIIAPPP